MCDCVVHKQDHHKIICASLACLVRETINVFRGLVKTYKHWHFLGGYLNKIEVWHNGNLYLSLYFHTSCADFGQISMSLQH